MASNCISQSGCRFATIPKSPNSYRLSSLRTMQQASKQNLMENIALWFSNCFFPHVMLIISNEIDISAIMLNRIGLQLLNIYCFDWIEPWSGWSNWPFSTTHSNWLILNILMKISVSRSHVTKKKKWIIILIYRRQIDNGERCNQENIDTTLACNIIGNGCRCRCRCRICKRNYGRITTSPLRANFHIGKIH